MEDGDALDASTVWLGEIFSARKPVAAAADNRLRLHPPNSRHDLEPLRAAVRKAGYTGRVVIHLGISREGTPEHVRVASPAFLANAAEVMSAIGTWRFRPGIRAGKQAAMPMEFNIDVSGPGP